MSEISRASLGMCSFKVPKTITVFGEKGSVVPLGDQNWAVKLPLDDGVEVYVQLSDPTLSCAGRYCASFGIWRGYESSFTKAIRALEAQMLRSFKVLGKLMEYDVEG